MNKYQKSLDVLKGLVLSTPILAKDFKKDFDTLQELIDNNYKLLKAIDKACATFPKFDTDDCSLCPLHRCAGQCDLSDKGGTFQRCTKQEWKEWLMNGK